MLGLVGGVLGVGLGLLGAWILPHFISDPIAISPAATAGAIVVAIGIGVAFGVYPASRAAKLPPSTPCGANEPGLPSRTSSHLISAHPSTHHSKEEQ